MDRAERYYAMPQDLSLFAVTMKLGLAIYFLRRSRQLTRCFTDTYYCVNVETSALRLHKSWKIRAPSTDATRTLRVDKAIRMAGKTVEVVLCQRTNLECVPPLKPGKWRVCSLTHPVISALTQQYKHRVCAFMQTCEMARLLTGATRNLRIDAAVEELK